jgi:hypothetical protein
MHLGHKKGENVIRGENPISVQIKIKMRRLCPISSHAPEHQKAWCLLRILLQETMSRSAAGIIMSFGRQLSPHKTIK